MYILFVSVCVYVRHLYLRNSFSNGQHLYVFVIYICSGDCLLNCVVGAINWHFGGLIVGARTNLLSVYYLWQNERGGGVIWMHISLHPLDDILTNCQTLLINIYLNVLINNNQLFSSAIFVYRSVDLNFTVCLKSQSKPDRVYKYNLHVVIG